MPEINASFRFSWEPATWGQSFKALFWTPSPGPTWFQDLEQFNMTSFTKTKEEGSPRSSDKVADAPFENSCNILHKAVAYLAKYNHPRLENILKRKFEEISSPEGLKNAFHSILLLSLRTHRPQMLEVCQKIISSERLKKLFDEDNMKAEAQKEAHFVAKPQHRVASISKSLLQNLQQPLMKIRKIIHYIFSTTRRAHVIDVNNPPNNPVKAQGLWTFYRDTLQDLRIILPATIAYCITRWKTSIVVATLLAVSITAVYQLSEPPAQNHSQFIAPELPAHAGVDDLQRSRDFIERCDTAPDAQLKQDPSAELIPYLLLIERSLHLLNKEREETINAGRKERKSNPKWSKTERGQHLQNKLKEIIDKIDGQKKHLEKVRNLGLRLEKLSQIRAEYEQKEQVALHFCNENTKNLEESEKVYMFVKYLALQVVQAESEAIIKKCKSKINPGRGSVLHVRSASDSSLQASNSAPAVLTRTSLLQPVTPMDPPDGQ